ncbi:hypothetical protein K2F43_06855 [Clostridium estertheticum]|uniref:ATP-binding protein n=1 Tax=Clostridium estertheticum TaxID=238834 RepID=UPI001C6F0890|nr:ATP-binding protein [Clostridium estertheticum]MBW9170928.1 hypothetical protein [Clostridium estertheticum]WLC74237.1 hypothetical protein KTC99_15900 [Clostridium estertheticum]
MKSRYKIKQVFILLNQLLIISFLCHEYLRNIDTGASSIMPLTIISLMLLYSIYIQFINLKGSYVLSQFSNLLLFLSWVFLLLRSKEKIFILLATPLYVFLPYEIIQFLLMFIFQDCVYTNKKRINFMLKTSCFLTLLSMLNTRFFYVMFMLQWVLNFVCFIYVLFKNRSRFFFVLKQERKNLISSIFTIIVPYIIYVFLFAKQSNYMENCGLYIIVALPLFSVHGIVKKNHSNLNGYILNSKINILLSVCLLCFAVIIGIILHFSILSYFLLLHCVVLFVSFYLTLLYSEIKQRFLNGETRNSEMTQENFYMNNIIQIYKEENIKNDFSNYLHDEVLQDLLSIKNMIYKLDKPQVKEIIIETLEALNNSIREEMQEYHPIMLKTLTSKENISNLLEMIKETYHRKKISISFVCDDNLFLVEPYNLILYRMLRELVRNAFKHSKCIQIDVFLSQKKGKVELVVEDNGIGLDNRENIDIKKHKGLASIQEQVRLLGGCMQIDSKKPSGLRVTIQITMRGDNSYEYFINR